MMLQKFHLYTVSRSKNNVDTPISTICIYAVNFNLVQLSPQCFLKYSFKYLQPWQYSLQKQYFYWLWGVAIVVEALIGVAVVLVVAVLVSCKFCLVGGLIISVVIS